MRCYVHLEDALEFTIVHRFNQNDGQTIKQLSLHFASALSAVHPEVQLNPDGVSLQTKDGDELLPNLAVSAVVGDGDDVFVSTAPSRSDAESLGGTEQAAAERMDNSEAAASATSNAVQTPCAVARTSESPATATIDALKPYLQAADTAWKARQYAHAQAVYRELLVLRPSLPVALRRLGEIELQAGRAEEALPFLAKAIRSEPRHLLGRLTYSQALCELSEWGDAISELESALEMTAEGSKAYRRVQIELGRALFKSGQQGRGGAILTALLKLDMEDPQILRAYGEACIELGQVSDALQIYLRLITQKSEDKAIRALLSRAFRLAGAVEALRSQLPFKPESAAAIAFIATVLKDHSVVDVSLELYAEAARLRPDSTSYALNFAHTLELKLNYPEALDVIRRHLDANPSKAVGAVSCSSVAAALPAAVEIAAQWRSTLQSSAAAPPPGDVADSGEQMLEPLPVDAGGSVDGRLDMQPAGSYDSDALDLLALYFTAVKILFIVGCLDAAVSLVRIVERARSVKDLHLTLVRNENAYYCCVAQLLTSMPRPLSGLRLLYVAGDSHSLSPGWRTLHWRGEQRLLRPVLVTGLKIWHLRGECDFFTKFNFKAAMASIPDGAEVVFAFGEIDCREGLLVAVERAWYRDLQEGIDRAIEIYIAALLELVAARQFRILVHPVPPVLPETRPTVTLFNRTLKARIAREARLFFLDFADALLDPDDGSFAKSYALDGTHLHPTYISRMEAVLPLE